MVEHGNLAITFEEKRRVQEADSWHEEIERRLAMAENRDKRAALMVRRVEDGWEFEIRDQGAVSIARKFLELRAGKRAFAPTGGDQMARQLAFTELEYLDRGPGFESAPRPRRLPEWVFASHWWLHCRIETGLK